MNQPLFGRCLADGWPYTLMSPVTQRGGFDSVDTGDDAVNRMFIERGHMGVLMGYRTRKLVPVQA